ncbi:hypothetical protein F5146DRAFT_1028583 [Armillaria mellea]|nr:hypothetical protein F5146DRAFT_1028583 [Armillaria mellea]
MFSLRRDVWMFLEDILSVLSWSVLLTDMLLGLQHRIHQSIPRGIWTIFTNPRISFWRVASWPSTGGTRPVEAGC